MKQTIKNIIFHLHYRFAKRKIRKAKYYFSLVLIFKDEAPYLAEWIEYHRIIGVDHVYAYDDSSTDNFYDILQPYIKNGYVTLVKWSKPHSQFLAYEDCYHRFREETSWMMFLDTDEFICPYCSTNVKDWIVQFEQYPAVIMYWKHFSTGGHIEYDVTKLVIERFTVAEKELAGSGKIVLNTCFEPVKIYHHFIYCWDTFLWHRWKVPTVKEDNSFVFRNNPNISESTYSSINTIQINHYWSKSWKEYCNKMAKGDVSYVEDKIGRETIENFYRHEEMCTCEDKIIFRYLMKLKLNMTNKL